MDINEIMKTWEWRIVRAFGTQRAFCKYAGVSQPVLSRYVNLKVDPGVIRFQRVENAIRRKEKELGFDV